MFTAGRTRSISSPTRRSESFSNTLHSYRASPISRSTSIAPFTGISYTTATAPKSYTTQSSALTTWPDPIVNPSEEPLTRRGAG